MAKAAKKGGRPSEFTQAMADAICDGLVSGRSLRSICADENMPAASTVFRWLSLTPKFSEQYARAREAQADALFDETLDIADDGTNDYVTRTNADGSTFEAIDHEHIARSKLRVDTRKWMAGKLQPKKYGDKVVNEHSGPDGGPIPLQRFEVEFVGSDKGKVS